MRTLRGRVVRGRRLGRTIGFPTANLRLPLRTRLPRGVWCVRVSGTTLGRRLAVCNVGVRPTVGGARLGAEVHVPGFRGDLYGRTLTVEFLKPLRAEKKFASLAALRTQIRRDLASLTRLVDAGTMSL